jgi:hypothetical protein
MMAGLDALSLNMSGQMRRPNPKVRRASIEVKVEDLGWSADRHLSEVLAIVLDVLRYDGGGVGGCGGFLDEAALNDGVVFVVEEIEDRVAGIFD